MLNAGLLYKPVYCWLIARGIQRKNEMRRGGCCLQAGENWISRDFKFFFPEIANTVTAGVEYRTALVRRPGHFSSEIQ